MAVIKSAGVRTGGGAMATIWSVAAAEAFTVAVRFTPESGASSCSTTSKGISLWQSGSGSARKGKAVSLSHLLQRQPTIAQLRQRRGSQRADLQQHTQMRQSLAAMAA